MVTSPNNGSFSNNLTFAQYQSNALPSWLSFDSSSANITSTNPSTSSSDTYTITNTYTGVTGSSFTLTTDLNISVSGSNSNNDDKHCFGLSSGTECGLVIFAIALAVIIPIIGVAIIVYCKWKRARNRANRDNVQQVCNQDNAQHQPVQQQDHEPMQLQDMDPETEARGMDANYQIPDDQI